MNDTPSGEPVEFFTIDEGQPLSPVEGVEMRAMFGRGGTLSLVTLEPGAELPAHSHPHEQLGIVLEGVQILVVGGVEYPLGPMQAYVIPSGVEHAGIGGPQGCVALDVFVPVRDDYRSAAVSPHGTAYAR